MYLILNIKFEAVNVLMSEISSPDALINLFMSV